jgi:hypothetical protein
MANEKTKRLDKLIDEMAHGMYLEGTGLFKKGKIKEAIECLQLPHAHYKNKGDIDSILLCENELRSRGYDVGLLELNHEENLKYIEDLKVLIKEIYTVSAN